MKYAATAHKDAVYYRDIALDSMPELTRRHLILQSRLHSEARMRDFKHSWRLRFGTPEPEPWA